MAICKQVINVILCGQVMHTELYDYFGLVTNNQYIEINLGQEDS